MEKILRFFLPDTDSVSAREKILSALLAFISVLICVYVSSFLVDLSQVPILIASLGASAILLFATPKSPVSQPWSILGGQIISSAVGVYCYQNIELLVLSASLAVGLSLLLMYFLRCLHPPGGASALGFVIAGPDIHALGYSYVAMPVLSNMALLLILGLIFNNLVPNRRYPNESLQINKKSSDEWVLGKDVFDSSDLESALQATDTFLDISRADLNQIYKLAVQHANKRRLGNVLCRDIMSKELLTLEYGIELEEAWQILLNKHIKAAPVIDRFNRIIGIVTITDFMRHANVTSEESLARRMQMFLQKTQGHHSDKHEVVGQIMTESPITVFEDQHIFDLVEIFTEKNIHHIPVVNSKKYLCGMVTRSDIMRAMVMLRI